MATLLPAPGNRRTPTTWQFPWQRPGIRRNRDATACLARPSSACPDRLAARTDQGPAPAGAGRLAWYGQLSGRAARRATCRLQRGPSSRPVRIPIAPVRRPGRPDRDREVHRRAVGPTPRQAGPGTGSTMPEVLDQSEIDSLLAAVAAGQTDVALAAETPTAAALPAEAAGQPRREVSTYDFTRPERVSKDHIRALASIHDGFARNFGATLSGSLRTIIDVRVVGVEQLTYSEFIHSLPNPTCFVILQAPPLEGQMCLEISPLIVYPIIDRLLGRAPTHSFTSPNGRSLRSNGGSSTAWSSGRWPTFPRSGATWLTPTSKSSTSKATRSSSISSPLPRWWSSSPSRSRWDSVPGR
jgi:hypothetical protein